MNASEITLERTIPIETLINIVISVAKYHKTGVYAVLDIYLEKELGFTESLNPDNIMSVLEMNFPIMCEEFNKYDENPTPLMDYLCKVDKKMAYEHLKSVTDIQGNASCYVFTDIFGILTEKAFSSQYKLPDGIVFVNNFLEHVLFLQNIQKIKKLYIDKADFSGMTIDLSVLKNLEYLCLISVDGCAHHRAVKYPKSIKHLYLTRLTYINLFISDDNFPNLESLKITNVTLDSFDISSCKELKIIKMVSIKKSGNCRIYNLGKLESLIIKGSNLNISKLLLYNIPKLNKLIATDFSGNHEQSYEASQKFKRLNYGLINQLEVCNIN